MGRLKRRGLPHLGEPDGQCLCLRSGDLTPPVRPSTLPSITDPQPPCTRGRAQTASWLRHTLLGNISKRSHSRLCSTLTLLLALCLPQAQRLKGTPIFCCCDTSYLFTLAVVMLICLIPCHAVSLMPGSTSKLYPKPVALCYHCLACDTQ